MLVSGWVCTVQGTVLWWRQLFRDTSWWSKWKWFQSVELNLTKHFLCRADVTSSPPKKINNPNWDDQMKRPFQHLLLLDVWTGCVSSTPSKLGRMPGNLVQRVLAAHIAKQDVPGVRMLSQLRQSWLGAGSLNGGAISHSIHLLEWQIPFRFEPAYCQPA